MKKQIRKREIKGTIKKQLPSDFEKTPEKFYREIAFNRILFMKCLICNSTFKSKSDIKQHLIDKHES